MTLLQHKKPTTPSGGNGGIFPCISHTAVTITNRLLVTPYLKNRRASSPSTITSPPINITSSRPFLAVRTLRTLRSLCLSSCSFLFFLLFPFSLSGNQVNTNSSIINYNPKQSHTHNTHKQIKNKKQHKTKKPTNQQHICILKAGERKRNNRTQRNQLKFAKRLVLLRFGTQKIALIVVLAVILLCVVLLFCFMLWRRRVMVDIRQWLCVHAIS